jgi:hypothetical protein
MAIFVFKPIVNSLPSAHFKLIKPPGPVTWLCICFITILFTESEWDWAAG